MEYSRGFKMMQLGLDRKRLASLEIPKYDRTSGTQKWERKLAIEGWASYHESVAMEAKIRKKRKNNKEITDERDVSATVLEIGVAANVEEQLCGKMEKNESSKDISSPAPEAQISSFEITDERDDSTIVLEIGVAANVEEQLCVKMGQNESSKAISSPAPEAQVSSFEITDERDVSATVLEIGVAANVEEQLCGKMGKNESSKAISSPAPEAQVSSFDVLSPIDNKQSFYIQDKDTVILDFQTSNQSLSPTDFDQTYPLDCCTVVEQTTENDCLKLTTVHQSEHSPAGTTSTPIEFENHYIKSFQLPIFYLDEESANLMPALNLYKHDYKKSSEHLTSEIEQDISEVCYTEMENKHPMDCQMQEALQAAFNSSGLSSFDELLPGPSKNSKEVQRRAHREKGTRVWDRKNFCLYCKSLVSNFSRHLMRWHPAEEEVMKYKSILDEDLKERKRKRQLITDSLRRRGNFLYNSSLSNNDDFLPTRRPPLNKRSTCSYTKYLTCRFCLGMFTKKTFHRHRQICSIKPTEKIHPDLDNLSLGEIVFGSKPKQAVSKSDGIELVPNVEGASELLKKRIFPLLQKDELALIAMNDRLTLTIASQFLSNHLDIKDEYNVTKKMRDCAKLLKKCRNDPEIKDLSDCLNPKKFKVVMSAVQELCGLDPQTGKVAVVGMPQRMSYILQEGAKILICEAITSDLPNYAKERIKTNMNEFLHLFKAQWKYLVSTNAEKSRKKQMSLKNEVMPDDEDIKVVAEKVRMLENEYYEKLKQHPDSESYEELCKLTIAHIIILNRRRAGEVARAELEYYVNRVSQDDLTEDVLNTLSEQERKVLPEFTVFMVPGKLIHTVPILLTKEMKRNVDLIVASRESLKISKTNVLLFPRISTKKPFDGSKILRELKQGCNLKRPNDFTSIGLRHHVATKSQIVQKDNYTENICQFMGHSSNIHKLSYRKPLQAIQKGQIGLQLMEMEGGIGTETITNTNLDKSDPIREESPEKNSDVDDPNFLPNHSSRTSRKRFAAKRRWSEEEKSVVLSKLQHYIKEIKKEPGMAVCLELIKDNPILAGRTWKQVNALVHNLIKGKTKMPVKL